MIPLAARDLSLRYPGAPAPALDGVTMTAEPGELYAVLGPNGSGKSTLMKVLLGVLAPTRGGALVDGKPVGRWRRRELARRVAAVPQSEPMPFPITVRDLVAMGRYPHLGPLRPEGPADREAVTRALERCRAAELTDRLAHTLSGGELQRARIARALAQEPDALLLDEPTASLDIRHAMSIAELLRGSADRGLTVLLVTHDLNLAARFADRILLLSGGSVAAEGDAWSVLRPEVLQEVYGWPLAVDADPATGAPRVTPVPGSAAYRSPPSSSPRSVT